MNEAARNFNDEHFHYSERKYNLFMLASSKISFASRFFRIEASLVGLLAEAFLSFCL